MSIDEQELQEWVKSLRNVIASSGFGQISDEGIYWIIYEYGKLLKNKPSGIEIESKEPEPYDAGFLNDFGGGNVSWWHDYIRSELERAHDHYTQQFIAPTRITEQDAREIFNSILEDQELHFDYWIENCGGRELLNKLNEDRQVSDDASTQRLWDYYQNLLKHYGFEGITDLLSKYRKLVEKVPEDGCLCQGCENRYVADLLVPDDVWEQIKPEGKPVGSGLLCPNCIMTRVVERGIWSAGRVEDINKPTVAVPDGLVNALKQSQYQVDADGTFIGVSRQALDEAIDILVMLSAPSHNQHNAEVVPLESVESLREYIDEWGDDADMQVVKSELGEMILRVKGTYGCSSHDSEQG